MSSYKGMFIREPLITKSKFPDYRAAFFLNVWRLLINRKTPPFYQARLMNIVSFRKELEMILSDPYFSRYGVDQLQRTCEELKRYIASDKYLHKALGGAYEQVNGAVDAAAQCKDKEEIINRHALSLKLVADLCRRTEQKYFEILSTRLIELTTGTVDTGKERILKEIFWTTSRLISCLLSRGYSSTYLYGRSKAIFRNRPFKNNSFQLALRQTLDRLLLPRTAYVVVLGAHFYEVAARAKSEFANIHLSIDLPEIIAEDQSHHLELTNTKLNGYVKIAVSSHDYISATWDAIRQFEQLRDLLSYEYKQKVVDISPTALVRTEDAHSPHVVRYQFLTNLIHSRSALSIDSISELLAMQTETSEWGPRVTRALRYYRLGLADPTFESKFLNMWISLESIFGGSSRRTIDDIVEIVSRLYALKSLKKRLQFVGTMLAIQKHDVPPELHERFETGSFTDEIAAESFFDLFQTESESQALFEHVDDDLVRFGLKLTFDEFKSKRSILKRYEKTAADVRSQIYRVYFIRNLIVHQAWHGDISPRLYGHLCDYVECIMDEVLNVILTARERISLDDIVESIRMMVNDSERQLTAAETVQYKDLEGQQSMLSYG